MSISAAICIYNDFDFIEDCIERVYDLVDEIVILGRALYILRTNSQGIRSLLRGRGQTP